MMNKLEVFSQKEQHYFFDSLIHRIIEMSENLPDIRKTKTANNLKYSMSDAFLSAFSVFFTQSPSFLDYQTRMEKAHGKNNAQSIFGIHKIPSMNQIRNLLDTVPETEIYPLFYELNQFLYDNGFLQNFMSKNNGLFIALDGTDFFSSQKISCPCCLKKDLVNGKVLYRHSALTPVIVAHGQSRVIPLPPEFIQAQDGAEKQDCEINAAKRWLDNWGKYYSSWQATLLGDDLFAHQPFFEKAIAQGFDIITSCKPNSHQTTYEWLSEFEQMNKIQSLQTQHKHGKQRTTRHYRYMNQVPLRDGNDALMVNWFELVEIDGQGKQKYKNSWITTHKITEKNLAELTDAARARWKIENENNNILKNNGYHFEHNFGHGKQHLSNLLATLILLAYLTHTMLEYLDETYEKVRLLCPSRRTFFEQLRTLMQYLVFDSWQHLTGFMLEALSRRNS
jgi:hypothetical protein